MRTVALTLVLLAAVAMPSHPASAVVFVTPNVVSSDDASAPGIDIASDGTVYIGAATGLPGPSNVYRSNTGGSSWVKTAPGLRLALPGGLAFDLAVAPNGRLATTDLWGGSSTVATSTDRGTTWTAQPFQGEVVQSRPWVTSPGVVVYHASQVPAGIVVAKSTDGGFTYGTRMVVAAGAGVPPGNIVADGAGHFGLLYSTGTGVTFVRTANDGLTLMSSVVEPTGGLSTLESYPIVASAGNGVLAATWTETGTATSKVGFSLSQNWGATWSVPQYVVTTGTSLYPWVAAQGSTIGISLYRTSSAGTPGSVPSSALWYESYLESTNLGSAWTAVQTVDVNPVKTGPICTDGLTCSADGELGDFQSMAFDAAGRPNLAYIRSVDGAADVEVRFVRGA